MKSRKKKIGLITVNIVIVLILLLTGCINQEIQNEIELRDLGEIGVLSDETTAYNIIDNKELAKVSIGIKQDKLYEYIGESQTYMLLIGESQYELRKNYFNNKIFSVHIQDEYTIRELQKSIITKSTETQKDLNIIRGEERYISYVILERGEDYYKISVDDYLDATITDSEETPNYAIRDEDNKRMYPKYIKCNEEKIYTVDDLLDTRINTENNRINEALKLLEQYPEKEQNIRIRLEFIDGEIEEVDDDDEGIIDETIKYTLTIEIQGQGTTDPSEGIHEYIEGIEVAITANPSEGWLFIQWIGDVADNNSEETTVTMDSDKTIKIVFEQKEYTVTFNGNGGSPTSQTEIIKHGEKVNDFPIFTKDGHDFKEWNTKKDGTGTIFTDNTIVEQDITVFAQWEEISLDNSISGTIQITHKWSFSEVTSNSDKEELFNFEIKYTDRETINKPEYVLGQIIVGFHEVTTMSQKETIFNTLEANILSYNKILSAYLLEIHESKNLQDEILDIQKMPNVRYAEPNYIYRALSSKTPNDEYYSLQWHYPLIRLPQAWNITTGNSGVRIAVLDTGINTAHPDLGANIDSISGYNFINNNTNYLDYNGHGTHVAGTIGANTNNGIGVSGVMWDVSIVPIKVLDDEGVGTLWDVSQGISYASGLTTNPSISQPVQIINMSLGGSGYSVLFKDTITAAYNAGVLLVAATGNKNDSELYYPAAFQEVIAVGATDFNFQNKPQKAPYSNYGQGIDIVAPGGNLFDDTNIDGFGDGVLSTVRQSYSFYEGTSMAAPHVSGVLGLMISNGIPANEAREILQRTAMDLGTPGFNYQTGHGLINAYWAVNNVNSFNIIVGYIEENTFIPIIIEEISLDDKHYNIINVPEGSYRILAHIDILKNNQLNYGDYYFISDEINFERNKSYSINITAKEISKNSFLLNKKIEKIK